MTGKKQKSKKYYFDQSESDVNIRCHYRSPDSDSESCDMSPEHNKEAKGKPFGRKLHISNKGISSLLRLPSQKHEDN